MPRGAVASRGVKPGQGQERPDDDHAEEQPGPRVGRPAAPHRDRQAQNHEGKQGERDRATDGVGGRSHGQGRGREGGVLVVEGSLTLHGITR